MSHHSTLFQSLSLHTPVAGEALHRFKDQPTLEETAAGLIAQALGRLTPPIELDPWDLALGWPSQTSPTGEPEHLQLPRLLIELFVVQRPLTVVPGYQVALRRQADGGWTPFSMDLKRFAEELDAVRPALIGAHCEALALHWGESDAQGVTHWKWMANFLRRGYRRDLALALANQRLDQPAHDLALTLLEGGQGKPGKAPGQVKAMLVQLVANGEAIPFDVRLDPHLLITLPGSSDVEHYLLFSPNVGVHYFSEARALDAFLEKGLTRDQVWAPVRLRLLAVDEDPFVALARTLLQTQLLQLESVAPWIRETAGTGAPVWLEWSSDALTGFFQLDAHAKAAQLRRLQALLPSWLQQAALPDRWRYGKALLRMASEDAQEGQAWFLEGIPTLEAYALQRLHTVVAEAYPGHPPLIPEAIELTLEHVVPDPTAVAGGPASSAIVSEPLALTALLVDNLASHPGAWLQVSPKPGASLPGWLDGTALRALVREADVGKNYPRLLRQRLLTGEEAAHRRRAFEQQVRLQLPLLAQELALRQAGDMDSYGVNLVSTALGLEPVANPGQLMALGVTAGEPYGIDPIAATYIFVESDQSGGPCVLYRPLHSEPLQQFCSLDALLENLAAPGELQDEALRWMTDLGRSRYSGGGWREPRVARFGLGSEFGPLERPCPARLALIPMACPVLDDLYHQVVEALIDHAQRRSVSDAEDRWLSLSQLAWTLFNGLLPLFSGPVATAGWLIQLSDTFARFLESEDKPAKDGDSARRELLFTLVMVLLSEAVRWPSDELSVPVENAEDLSARLEEAAGAIDPPAREARALFEGADRHKLSDLAVPEVEALASPLSFEPGWASPEPQLNSTQRQALTRLRVVEAMGSPSLIEHGPAQGLYLFSERFLVKMDGDFFTVSLEPTPRILGPHGEPGPFLRRDEVGRWALDLRLRLRGGGPKRRIEARRQQNAEIRAAAQTLYGQATEAFDRLLNEVNPALEQIQRQPPQGEAMVLERERLHRIFEEGYQRCSGLLKDYQALQMQTPLPDFAEQACGLLARLLSITKSITHNLVELNRAYFSSSPFARWHGEALDRYIEDHPQAWQQFLERQDDISQRELNYVLAHQEAVSQLEEFPGIGAAILKRNDASVALVHSALELHTSLTYCRIGLITESMRRFPELSVPLEDALEPALIYAESHAQVVGRLQISDEERIQIFDTAINEYQRVEDTLQLLEETLEPEMKTPAMARLRATLDELVADAQQRLGGLVRETMVYTPQAPASRAKGSGRVRADVKPSLSNRSKSKQGARPPRPRENAGAEASPSAGALEVIRTADGQTLMARVRTDSDTHTRIATVTSNHQVVGTWREDPQTGQWLKPTRKPSRKPGEGVRLKQLEACMREAQSSLTAARKELARISHLKRVTRLPVDLQDQFHGRARQLDLQAEQIERALTGLNQTDAAVDRGSAELKAHELRDQASRCREAGTQARIELSLSLPPTPGHLAFLLEQGRVSIRRLGQRVPLGRPGRRDFLQEYEVRDSAGHPLWYAHFHYDSAEAAAERYTAAHLKTVTQRFDGYQKQLEQARSDQEVVSIYRSRIEPNMARRLFFSLP